MTSICLTEKEPHVAAEEEPETLFSGSIPAGTPVRRPLLGLVVDPEDRYASLTVISEDADGKPRVWDLLDQGTATGTTKTWSNFLLQSAQRRRMEKAQIIQTFGANYWMMFGEEPQFVMCQGMVLQAPNFQWASEFEFNYERYLRGTRCAETKSRVTLRYGTKVFEGLLMSMAMDEQAAQDNMRPLTFNFGILRSRDTAVPDVVDGKPPASYTRFTSSTATILRTGRPVGTPVQPTEMQYSEVLGNFVQQGGQPGDRSVSTPEGRQTTEADQPMSYDDSGQLKPRSRSLRSRDERLPFLGRDRALLEVDLLVQAGDLGPEVRPAARFEQRRVGGYDLADAAAAAALEKALLAGSVGSSVVVIE